MRARGLIDQRCELVHHPYRMIVDDYTYRVTLQFRLLFVSLLHLIKMVYMRIEVEKKDIRHIGHTHFCEDECLSIEISSECSNVDIILLRSILKSFGKEYEMKSIDDFRLDEEGFTVTDLAIRTNLPWTVYEETLHSESTPSATIPVEFKKTDITHIGNTGFRNEKGCTCFTCDAEHGFGESCILEEILKCFGDYKITERNSFITETNSANVWIETNLPFGMYMSIIQKETPKT